MVPGTRNFVTIVLIILIISASGFVHGLQLQHLKLEISAEPKVLAKVDERFLSVALGCGLIKEKWSTFDFSSVRLQTLAMALSPVLLRMGGTECDFVIFQPDMKLDENQNLTMKKTYVNFTMTAQDFDDLNVFAQKVNWSLLFDINVLLRDSNGQWDSTNAKEFLDYSAKKGYQIHFELGNEPNSFQHKFNISIPGERLGKDFHILKSLLQKYSVYRKSLLVGPDVTRPRSVTAVDVDALEYLKSFLQTGRDAVDAVTFHQYYVNGRSTKVDDFLNSTILNILPDQIEAVKQVVNYYKPGSPVWLGETSSAYGGGAPGLSDRYIAGFMWLDKLGVSAMHGISLVLRQAFYAGHYSLIDKDLNPLPDFWLSLIYKRLVGDKVLKININSFRSDVRLYTHCAKNHAGGVTVYALNLQPKGNAVIRLVDNLAGKEFYEYLLEPDSGDLSSRFVNLNGKTLALIDDKTLPALDGRYYPANSTITLPHQTFAFYVIPNANISVCTEDLG